MFRHASIAILLFATATLTAHAATPATPTGAASRSPATTRLTRNFPVTSTAIAPDPGAAVPLDPEYARLGQPNTSIFQADRTPTLGNTPNGTLRNWGDPPPPPPPAAPIPVFRAALIDDAGPMALLEFTDAAGNISNLIARPGQFVTQINATITDVSLTNLQLQSANTNRTTTIPIGFNTNGIKLDTLPIMPQSVTPTTSNSRQQIRNGFNRGAPQPF